MSVIHVRGLSTAPTSDIFDKGRYLAEIVSAEPVVSKNKGTPGIKFDFLILQGPAQESGSEPAGRHLFWTMWLPETGPGYAMGLTKLARLCKAAGIPPEDDFDCDVVTGRRVILTVRVSQSDNGEDQNDVSSFSAYRETDAV